MISSNHRIILSALRVLSFLCLAGHCTVKAQDSQSYKEEEKAFLKANKSVKGVRTLQSGLQVMILNRGKGRRPTLKDEVYVKYKGHFVDGTVFDESLSKPAVFRMSGVIPGMKEGLSQIGEGGSAVLYVPSKLAYGSEGAGQIPPDRMLIFEVELIEIYCEED